VLTAISLSLMIRFKNVSKYYPSKQGRKYILRDVTLDIPTDRSVGILGPNGVGKSTLMRLIGGSDSPNKGSITTDQKISWPIGLGGGLQGSMTARENTRFVAKIVGVEDVRSVERFVEEFAEIGASFDEPIKTYSSGMKSRVGFGLSLAFDFDVLLMDEVGAVGDQIFKVKSEALLQKKINDTHILLVSHAIAQHRRLCQSGVVIKDQQLFFYEDIEEAIEDYEATYIRPALQDFKS